VAGARADAPTASALRRTADVLRGLGHTGVDLEPRSKALTAPFMPQVM
jgi:hypothetical protein